MGMLDGLLGNASEIKPADVEEEFKDFLVKGEKIEKAYILIRDLFIFTNKRFILVDKQGLSGKKVEYRSLPYGKISHFSIETAGTFDLDAELKIWMAGHPLPIQKRFNRKLNIYEVQKVLASRILK